MITNQTPQGMYGQERNVGCSISGLSVVSRLSHFDFFCLRYCRDLLPTPPSPGDVPSCAEGGVLGVLPGVIGCIQVRG